MKREFKCETANFIGERQCGHYVTCKECKEDLADSGIILSGLKYDSLFWNYYDDILQIQINLLSRLRRKDLEKGEL